MDVKMAQPVKPDVIITLSYEDAQRLMQVLGALSQAEVRKLTCTEHANAAALFEVTDELYNRLSNLVEYPSRG